MSHKKIKTLADGIREELARNKELLKAYREIGPAGEIGAMFIEETIKANGKSRSGRGHGYIV